MMFFEIWFASAVFTIEHQTKLFSDFDFCLNKISVLYKRWISKDTIPWRPAGRVERFLELITTAVNNSLTGVVFSKFHEHFYDGCLRAPKEDDNCPKQIAVKETLRRICWRIVCRRLFNLARSIIFPSQLSVSLQSSCDRWNHNVRQVLKQGIIRQRNLGISKVDLGNASN